MRRSRLVVALAAAALACGLYFLHPIEMARIGAGYAAEQTCACLFISHRTLESCRGDLEPLAQRFVSLAPGADSVAARSFGFAQANARFHAGEGCTLDP